MERIYMGENGIQIGDAGSHGYNAVKIDTQRKI